MNLMPFSPIPINIVCTLMIYLHHAVLRRPCVLAPPGAIAENIPQVGAMIASPRRLWRSAAGLGRDPPLLLPPSRRSSQKCAWSLLASNKVIPGWPRADSSSRYMATIPSGHSGSCRLDPESPQGPASPPTYLLAL